MRDVGPGLRYWAAPHPQWNGATEWPEEVGCVYYEAADALALIDPLLPRGSEESFLAALDRDVAHLNRPVAVMLTAPWHKRDAALIAERYGTTVWAHPAAQARLPFETQAGPLPDGVETFSAVGVWEGDVAFYIRPRRALVVAEFFMGIDGGLRVCPSPALQDRAEFERSLQTLLHWPIDHVLVGHGEPVIGNGGRRINEALRAFAETRADSQGRARSTRGRRRSDGRRRIGAVERASCSAACGAGSARPRAAHRRLGREGESGNHRPGSDRGLRSVLRRHVCPR